MSGRSSPKFLWNYVGGVHCNDLPKGKAPLFSTPIHCLTAQVYNPSFVAIQLSVKLHSEVSE